MPKTVRREEIAGKRARFQMGSRWPMITGKIHLALKPTIEAI